MEKKQKRQRKAETVEPRVGYACGHETDGVIIMDDNEMSLTHYLIWSEGVGIFGNRSFCFDCYLGGFK